MNITGKTRLVGVIGWPIAHSMSPPMQNAAVAKLGLDWVYVAMLVAPEGLGAAVAGAAALGFAGINVTIPHKEAVLPMLAEIDPAARAIGAVNTIHFTEQGAVGYNTDADGYVRTVEQEGGFSFAGATVLQIGTGGAGRAMAAGAAKAGAGELRLYDLDHARAKGLAETIAAHYPKVRVRALSAIDLQAAEGADLVANATPLGMKPGDPLPLPEACLVKEMTVFDAVYNPAETALLAAARRIGARPVGGLGMLARQGARALAIWTGAAPDEELMLQTLRDRLGR